MQRLQTVDAFIAWEESQERKFEFSDGEISMLPGGSLGHGLIAANIIYALRSRGFPPHTVMTSDVKVVTDRESRYPDVTVLGDLRDTNMRATFVRHPTMLFEVLSPSTRDVDRVAKVETYLAIDTVKAYVLVDSTKRWAQVYRRAHDGWRIDFPITTGDLAIAPFAIAIPLDELYAGTEL